MRQLGWHDIASVLKKYMKFVGPGLMVSVAYMDPGNYSTAVAAGAAYKYKLLFLIFLLNCLAIFLQILSAKLGAVTGLDLAANCRANLPFKINIFVYILAEIAIIATDLAEVVGTAIALNIIFKLPLFLGVIVTVVDVLIVLMAYRPKGPLLFIRIFESFVSVLVGATVVCFAIELYAVSHDSGIDFSLKEVLLGFLPNDKVVDMKERDGGNGLFLSLAILGATVMPHSLYLGSGLVQARLKDFDIKHGHYIPPGQDDDQHQLAQGELSDSISHKDDENDDEEDYRPSIHAIDDTMSYTIMELVVSLFTVALFVNASILIVAGSTLNPQNKRDDDDGHQSDTDDDDDHRKYQNADLFTIYNLLSTHLSPTAGFVFALALLCSGQSAGVVCTLAGQMVLEGFLLWSLPPVTRRLITRGLAIVPCLVVVSIAGREGLSNVLNVSQVVLSLLLPAVTAPLIIFTCSKEIMRVPIFHREGDEGLDESSEISEPFDLTSRTPTLVEPTKNISQKNKRFKSTEPAIKLQDLRNSHPCAGWDDDEEMHPEEHQRLVQTAAQAAAPDAPSNQLEYAAANPHRGDSSMDMHRVVGYKDMSNGPLMSLIAILIWGFVTCLNLYLIGNLMLGYDTPF